MGRAYRTCPASQESSQEQVMSSYSTISSTLWNEYGETLPDSPTRIANHIIMALRADGFKIIDTTDLTDTQ